MRMRAGQATTWEKEPWQTFLILHSDLRRITSKVHLLESYYSIVSEFDIELLEYKGCALAIADATQQVAFSIWCKRRRNHASLQPKWGL